jgi:hypothetical protein
MKRYQKRLLTVLVFPVVLIFACVTVNIYFPAEKVESVAGEIVGEIRGNKGGGEEKPTEDNKGSFLRQTRLALSPSTAWAQDVTSVSNPTIRALKEKLRNNYNRMKAFYLRGNLEEGNDGYVSVKNAGALNLKERRDLNNLVNAENGSRARLYEEVAKALKIDSSQIDRIGGIFAKEWQKSVR